MKTDKDLINKKLISKYIEQFKEFYAIYKQVKFDFIKADLPAHNWEHIYRDIVNAIIIGEAEKADMSIVLPAIILHDIGFLYGASSKIHGAIGADKLPEYLQNISISYSNEIVAHIAACIRTHKGSMHNEQPATLEAKVVADADLLDKFGPVGVYQRIRTIAEFRGDIYSAIEGKEVIKKLALSTETGKKLAEPGRQFVTDFFTALEQAYLLYC